MNRDRLLQTFVLANEFKEGDLLVGGTHDEQVRMEARAALASLRLGEISRVAFVEDAVTEALQRSVDPHVADQLAGVTVAQLKEILLSTGLVPWLADNMKGLSSEAIAAVVKTMTNEELASVSGRLFNSLPGPGIAIGSSTHFGSRIQPNSPSDDEDEILFSILEGLTYGCGDVILGLNPASDDVDTIVRLEKLLESVVGRLELPTRYSVLSDIVKQTSARARTRVDVGFQSLAGTSKAIVGMVGLEIDGLVDLARGFDGLYFETGQGSAVTNQAAEGVDMVTLEARAYGLARHIRNQTGSWMIVNDVAGFIGPEVFCTGEQLVRACLEDAVMAKLHGITMGLDVCATFHMDIGPSALKRLTSTIVEQAAPAYLMAVAGNADPMLGYLTTSFREHPRLRRQTNRQIASAMKKRLIELGAIKTTEEPEGKGAAQLYARYEKAGGNTRSLAALAEDGGKKIASLRERGFDLGYGCGPDQAEPPEVNSRMEAIYSHARRALYERIDEGVIREASGHYIRIRSRAVDREDYLRHPPAGELIREEDAARVRSLYSARRPRVQIVISDGLNANAIDENLKLVLPELRRRLVQEGHDVGDTDIVIENGRVRAGYEIGSLLRTELLIHLIGERPGTGINTMSAYITFGLDPTGNSRWEPSFDHSRTTAICGINRRGKQPGSAIEEIARVVDRMLKERRSGVELGESRE